MLRSMDGLESQWVGSAYVHDAQDGVGRGVELAHVHVEMVEVVVSGLLQDEVALLADGMDAKEVAGRVFVGVWCGWDVGVARAC